MSKNARLFLGFLSLLIMLMLSLVSCEKTIDVDLDEVAPQIVIEAPLQSGTHDFEVRISQTTDYFNSEPTPAIENAVVILKDGGDRDTIPHLSNGIYRKQITALSNKSYQLEVIIGDITYEASSFLAAKIELQEIDLEFEEANFRFDEGYVAYFRFQDPANEANYYRFLYAIDGILQDDAEDLLVNDDRILNGSYARRALFAERFESGTNVTFILRHFDGPSYDYFNSLSDIVGDGGGPAGGVAAPGNPNSNWSAGALGYFSAFSDDTLNLTIP